MGYYIQGPAKDKANFIVEKYGGEIVSRSKAFAAIDNSKMAVVVVLDNGPFEAAGFAYSMKEFQAFTDPGDTRDKQFVIMNRELAKKLTGYERD